MGHRRLNIPVWLLAAALFATFVIGSNAGPVIMPDVRPAFRIVTSGVSYVITQDVTPEIARTLQMNQATGVLVSDVGYSPLRQGDVILSINGHPVGCERELEEQLSQVSPGQSFSVEILRDGRIQIVTVQKAMEAGATPMELGESGTARGITVAGVSTRNGVLVEDVQIGTPASDAGLKSGDFILDVDGHPVHSADEFVGFLRQLINRNAVFNVLQTNGQVNVFSIPS